MGKTITNHPGGATTTKFDSLEELQSWAKGNIDNPAVLAAVMSPLKVPAKKEQLTGAEKETAPELASV